MSYKLVIAEKPSVAQSIAKVIGADKREPYGIDESWLDVTDSVRDVYKRQVMDLSDLKEILRLLQISGNNLNQYAKKANETGSIYHELSLIHIYQMALCDSLQG